MKDLLKLLETINRKQLLGTLVLGRGKRSYEIFFEEDLLYLPENNFLEKIDLNGLSETNLLGKKASEAAIDTMALSTNLSKTVLPEVLLARNLINEQEFEELVHLHLQEEIFTRLNTNSKTFHCLSSRQPLAV